MTSSSPSPSPLTPEEIAAVRRPYRAASLLPGRAYHDPAIHDFEREQWFRRDWLIVGREADAAAPGTYFLAEVDDEPLIVVRGRDDVVRAFYNVCRHRGTAVVEEPCGMAVRFQCPYHAWIYDLDGRLIRAKHTEDLDDFSLEASGLATVRVETWQGFVFVNLDPAAPELEAWLGDLVSHLDRFDFGALRVAHTETYEVDANWKFIAENYSECYHCPGIHPQLNKLTPYDLGGDYAPDGPWQGGWMELVEDAETMALDGGHRAGRPAMRGHHRPSTSGASTTTCCGRPRSCRSTPTTCSSIGSSRPARATPGSSASGCSSRRRSPRPASTRPTRSSFWDLTNRQDWHVCELQQRGHAVAQLDRRPLLQPGAERPRVRPDGGRPVRGTTASGPTDRPLALRRPAPEGRAARRGRGARPSCCHGPRRGRARGRGQVAR